MLDLAAARLAGSGEQQRRRACIEDMAYHATANLTNPAWVS